MTEKRRVKRRGNGEGSIHQKTDKLWAATISLGFGGDGKRKRRTVYGKTKKEVADKLTALQSQKLIGSLTGETTIRTDGWLTRWLDDFAAQAVRPGTLAGYRLLVTKHISPNIGGVLLHKLNAVQIQELYSKLQRAGKSPRLIQQVHAVLHRSMSRAIKLGLIRMNPCYGVERPRVPKHEIEVLEPAQAWKLLEAAQNDRLHALYVLALTTGMRQGELFGLQWQDVDLEGAVLSVRRTVYELGKEILIGEPKSKKGIRRITLPTMAVNALTDHRKRMLAEGYAGLQWVFCSSEGHILRRNNVVNRSFHPLLKAAGLPKIRFHDLRHASASLLLSRGVHPKVVQERLGHSQINVTLDTYSHVLQGMDALAAGTFDEVLRKKA